MVNRDNERRHEVTERAQKQLDSFARDAERKLTEKMELMSENKEANIKALQHRLHKHVRLHHRQSINQFHHHLLLLIVIF